eukprot:c22021_g3_i1 orf=351-1595(+)
MPAAQGLNLSKLSILVDPKRRIDPLPEAVRAQLYGNPVPTEGTALEYYSTGGGDPEPSSICLAAMVHEFMENGISIGQKGRSRCKCLNGACTRDSSPGTDNGDFKSSFWVEVLQILQESVPCVSSEERHLLEVVTRIVDLTAKEDIYKDRSTDCTNCYQKRAVMKQLRNVGYNAAICKSRWDHSRGYPAGDYEYIDILIEEATGKWKRLVVDIDFQVQFEIARPTSHYLSVLQVLPSIFVGEPDKLQKILNLMSEAAKQSLAVKGLHLPPWRTPDYMRAKWFSSYERTVNDLVYPHRSDATVCRTFAGVALRESRLDMKCTRELEMLYLETNRRSSMNAMTKDHTGIVENSLPSEKGEITVMSTDWQPPAVNPRSTQKQGKVAGLASILMQAGLTVQPTSQDVAKQHERLALAA